MRILHSSPTLAGGVTPSPAAPCLHKARNYLHASIFTTNASPSARRPPRLRVRCIGWDPEGLLGAPQGGHIARRSFQKSLQQDRDAREILEKQARLEVEQRRAAREARVVPKTTAGLVDFFLETEAGDIEYEIARCKRWLNDEFFTYLQNEMGSLRFSLNRTKEMDERLVELEALLNVLKEGVDAYNKMAADLIEAKDRLARILASKDKRTTLLEMVEKNELDRSLLALLDENISAANLAGQEEAVMFMEKIRGAVLKYITL